MLTSMYAARMANLSRQKQFTGHGTLAHSRNYAFVFWNRLCHTLEATSQKSPCCFPMKMSVVFQEEHSEWFVRIS